jgi:hypothetical protein
MLLRSSAINPMRRHAQEANHKARKLLLLAIPAQTGIQKGQPGSSDLVRSCSSVHQGIRKSSQIKRAFGLFDGKAFDGTHRSCSSATGPMNHGTDCGFHGATQHPGLSTIFWVIGPSFFVGAMGVVRNLSVPLINLESGRLGKGMLRIGNSSPNRLYRTVKA